MSAAAVKKSIYLVIAHGEEVLVGFNQNNLKASRPDVPPNTEIILFESCGGYLPSIIDCPLMKLFMDKSAEPLLENPSGALIATQLKEKIGLPIRLYRAGEKHPEINLTLQASWPKGKYMDRDLYSIIKSGTYKYPLTSKNFPALGTEYTRSQYTSRGFGLPFKDEECHKYANFYTDDDYKEIIRSAFDGSVYPKAANIKPNGGAKFMIDAMYLSEYISKMKKIDPSPSVFYIITCRAIPKAAISLLKYHKNVLPSIHRFSPERMRLKDNINPEERRRAEEKAINEEKAKQREKELSKALRKLKRKSVRKQRLVNSLLNNLNGVEESFSLFEEEKKAYSPKGSPKVYLENKNVRRQKYLSKEESKKRKTQRRKRLPLYEEEALPSL